MRNFIIALVLSVCPLLFSCTDTVAEPDPQPSVPEKTELELLSDGRINVPYEGGRFSVEYLLENPLGGVISASSPDAWIAAIDDDRLGTVSFEVLANSKSETREGSVIVTYIGADTLSVSVEVLQEPAPLMYDIDLNGASCIEGVYNGDRYDVGANQYYFHLSDKGFDAEGAPMPDGMFFRFDLWSVQAPGDGKAIGLPEGVFVLGDSLGDGILNSNGCMYYTSDSDGIGQEMFYYSEAQCVIERDGDTYSIEFTGMLQDGRSVHVSYSGSVSLDDNRPREGIGTLTGDYQADFSGISEMHAYYYGDYYNTGAVNWSVGSFDEGDGLQLDLMCASYDPLGPEPGTYTSSSDYVAGTYVTGNYYYGNLLGTWLLIYESYQGVLSGYAPAITGDIVLERDNEGVYTISVDCYDDLGNNFTGTWTGKLTIHEEEK